MDTNDIDLSGLEPGSRSLLEGLDLLAEASADESADEETKAYLLQSLLDLGPTVSLKALIIEVAALKRAVLSHGK